MGAVKGEEGEEGEGPERAGLARVAAKVVGGRVGGSWPVEVAAAAPEGQSVAALRRGEGNYYYRVVTDNEAESDSAAVQCAHATPPPDILLSQTYISDSGYCERSQPPAHAPALT